MYIETWSQFVNKKHLIDETVKLAVAFFEDGKVRSEIFRYRRVFVKEMLANRRRGQRVGEHRHTSYATACNSKFDCLIYEMFFINELRPSLNVQCDSIRAKVFK